MIIITLAVLNTVAVYDCSIPVDTPPIEPIKV